MLLGRYRSNDALAAGIVDAVSMQLVSGFLVRPRLQLNWSGQVFAKKSWSNTTFRRQPGTSQISRKPAYIEEKE